MNIVTRFPPSPTGYFHIGSARTALFNHLFARHHGGLLYLRFEDTDRGRNEKRYEEDIVEGLRWLGIEYRLPAVYRQSERTELYKKHLTTLIEKGAAYEAETATDDPLKKVVRFKNPNTTIRFDDLVRGTVSFDTSELKDFVIAKNLDEPLYHLAVAVDDHDMLVTHVIRGEDHISNTPRQILILEALGYERPTYAHIPLILAPDRSKLSKRHGAVSVNEYRAMGFLPQALVNYLALLGWNPGGEQEMFTLEELSRSFSIERVHKSGAIFDKEKLRWLNHEYLRKLTDKEYLTRLKECTSLHIDAPVAPLLKERFETLKDAADALTAGEFDFLSDKISYDSELLLKGAKTDAKNAAIHLKEIERLLTAVSTHNPEEVRNAVFPYATEQGRASVLWPLRVALSGKEKSPDPFTLAGLLGKEKTLRRIKIALQKLSL